MEEPPAPAAVAEPPAAAEEPPAAVEEPPAPAPAPAVPSIAIARPPRQKPTMQLHSRAQTRAKGDKAKEARWRAVTQRISDTIRISLRISRASKVPAPPPPDDGGAGSDRWTSERGTEVETPRPQ